MYWNCKKIGLLVLGVIFCWVPVTHAIVIETPAQGTIVHPGDTVLIRVVPSPGEKIAGVQFDSLSNDAVTRPPYEFQYRVNPKEPPGKITVSMFSFTSDEKFSSDTDLNLIVALPSTTVLQGIEAKVGDEKETTIFLRRDMDGKVLNNLSSELEVKGLYSDGVKRDISIDPKTTYTSSDEKVIRPKGIDLEDKVMILEMLSSGKAIITVRNGTLEDTVGVEVKEKECPPDAIKDGRVVNALACRPAKKK